MSGEGACLGVKHSRPRARVASKPTPATQTILCYCEGLGFLSFSSFALFLFWGDLRFTYLSGSWRSEAFRKNDQFKYVRVWRGLRLGVASALFGPSAWQGLLGPSNFSFE